MNEVQWLSSTSLYEMLEFLKVNFNVQRKKAGRRKLRLYCCACAHRIWDRLDAAGRALVEGVELMLDGQLSEEEVQRRSATLTRPFSFHVGHDFGVVATVSSTRYLNAMALSAANAIMSMRMVDEQCITPGSLQLGGEFQRIVQEENIWQATLAREIFGNPFRPLPQRKFPAEVRGLAQACVEDHTNYPLLADALEDLDEATAAAHCREPGHVRGCHVVDWILGKS